MSTKADERISQADFETKLKAAYSKLGAVECGGLTAYFRRPTAEEHATFTQLSQDDDAKGVAYTRYVQGCYVGSWPENLTIEDIIKREGPGVVNGSFGLLVNKLAGSEKRPTRLL